MNANVLVIGLDGACWGLIDDWIDSGDLPNIRQLKENGLWGDMKSCIPPITCPAWKCYSTGKNPGKLGVYWWNSIDLENRKIDPSNASLFKSKEIWDYLNEFSIKTGIIGMPLTYPPKKVKGFMISGGPDSGSKNYLYPSFLMPVLKKIGYKVHPNTVFAGNIEKEGEEIEELLQIIQQKFEVARKLMKIIPVDFLQITTFYLNELQHFFYNEEPVKKAWKLIDKEIGRIRDLFQYIILVSDHGTAPLKQNFFLNAWLKQNGYLYRKKTFRSFLYDVGIHIGSVAKFLDLLNIKNLLGRFEILRKIGYKLPTSLGIIHGLGGEATLEGIDWNKTKAIALPQGPIYIKKKELSLQEYEDLRNEIIYSLKMIRSKDGGKKIFEGVYKSEDIYKGPYVNKAPDIVALDSDSFHNLGGLLRNDLFADSIWKGNNARNGLFLINGPRIRPGKVEKVEIYDVAPTILTIFGCPIPPDIDGRPLINESARIRLC